MRILAPITFIVVMFIVGIMLMICGIMLNENISVLFTAANSSGVGEQAGPLYSMIKNVFQFIGGFLIIASLVGFIVIMFARQKDEYWRG